METPSTIRRSRESRASLSRSRDPGSCLHYSLFLPDPEAVDRLAATPAQEVFEAMKHDVTSNERTIPIVVLDPKTVIAEKSMDAQDLVQVLFKSVIYEET